MITSLLGYRSGTGLLTGLRIYSGMSDGGSVKARQFHSLNSNQSNQMEKQKMVLALAGVSFRLEQFQRADVKSDDVLSLKPEPTNKFDKHAIQVLKGEEQIGYIPKEFSEGVSELIEDGKIHSVKVIRSWSRGATIELQYA